MRRRKRNRLRLKASLQEVELLNYFRSTRK